MYKDTGRSARETALKMNTIKFKERKEKKPHSDKNPFLYFN